MRRLPNRIHASHVAFLGMSATTSELCKNLVLAGVGAVTLVDCREVTADDAANNVLLRPESVAGNVGFHLRV